MGTDNTIHKDNHPIHAPHRGAHKPQLPTPALDMNTVASKHPEALAAAVDANAAVARGDRGSRIHALEELQRLPKTEQAVAAKIALSPGSPLSVEAKPLTKLFGVAPGGVNRPNKMTP